ncbi:anthocyanin 5-aromatic acyltransferase-like [Typha angustifolia]|uniref:anthocyanin 5-aromatic acyltransferase-like n=1 Tax=Typha angustifolia TaxID=59011 RepID=UPI003C2E1B87
MSIQVRILNVAHVSLPESPTPPNDRIALSIFDVPWLPLPPIQRLVFYDDTSLLPSFPSLLQSLKSSLSSTLLHFSPLAGKITYLPASGDVIIDSSAAAVGDGVAFLEAEADGDIHRLARDEEPDVEAYLKLVPCLDVGKLPAPVLSVQVTRFASCGVALGFSVHHMVADGKALWRFLEAWTACCRGGPPFEATFDRAVVRHPREEEIVRRLLRTFGSALPLIATHPGVSAEDRFQLSRRTFVVGFEAIHSLKQRILLHNNPPPSTFVAISAKIWIAFVRSKSFKPTDDVYLTFLADCRARFDPPVDDRYFGNCVKGCFARAIVADLLGEDGLSVACSAIQEAIREYLEVTLAGSEDWMEKYAGLPSGRVVNVAASPRFKVYELSDFGWGKPSRVELVSMNRDGEVVLVGAREEGKVQISVALDRMHMEAFKNYFVYDGANGC